MSLFDIIERLANLQLHTFTAVPAFRNLPPVQIRALYYLFRCNHYSNSPGAVTEYLGLTKGTVSQSLRKLEEQGFITRESDVKDKRKVKLYLSARTQEALEEAMRHEGIVQAERSLPDGGLDLEQQLKQILRIVQQNEGVRLFGVCQHCRFHQQKNGFPFCELTNEAIPPENTTLICREFEER